MQKHFSYSVNASPNNSFSYKKSPTLLKPLYIDLSDKEPQRQLAALKSKNACAKLSSSLVSKPHKVFSSAPESPKDAHGQGFNILRKMSQKIFKSVSKTPSNAGETLLRKKKVLKKGMSQELSELYQYTPSVKNYSFDKTDKMDKTWNDVTHLKPEQQVTLTSHIRKSSQSIERRQGTEVSQIRKHLEKVMDNSREKSQIEKLRRDSIKHKELQQISQELNHLRKLTQDLTPLAGLFSRETPKTSELMPQNSKRSNFNPLSPHNLSKNDVYRMDPEYKQTLEQAKAETNVNVLYRSRPHAPRHSGFPQAPESEDSTPESQETSVADQAPQQSQFSEYFDRLVVYQDTKLPFTLALTAKTRQTLFEEVKQRNKDQGNNMSNLSLAMQFRNKLIPEERAKFLGQLDDIEKQKKYKELKSKQGNSTALYQMLAMSKNSQKKLRAKLEEKFAPNSRFLADYIAK